MTFNKQGNWLLKTVIYRFGPALVPDYTTKRKYSGGLKPERSSAAETSFYYTDELTRSCGCICPKSLPFQLVLLVRMSYLCDGEKGRGLYFIVVVSSTDEELQKKVSKRLAFDGLNPLNDTGGSLA